MAKVGKAPFVLVTEAFNRKTGLGSRFRLLAAGTGLHPQVRLHRHPRRRLRWSVGAVPPTRALTPDGIMAKVKELAK